MFIVVIINDASLKLLINALHFTRLKDAHKSEARRFLRSGVQLAGEEEEGAGRPPALSGHADLPG